MWLYGPLAYRIIWRHVGTEPQKEKPDEMSVGVLDHYNVSTRKLKQTVEFDEDVLGFYERSAAAVQFPRRLALQRQTIPVLHLNDISQDRPGSSAADSGVIDHVAFGSRGFEAMKQHLTGKGIRHRVNQVPNTTRWQIFLRDPNNVEIELNFETRNEMRSGRSASDEASPIIESLVAHRSSRCAAAMH